MLLTSQAAAHQSNKQAREAKAAAIKAKIAALPNLTDEQRDAVEDMVLAHVASHSGQEPSYEGIASHVRKQK
jgi:hypothetical protein